MPGNTAAKRNGDMADTASFADHCIISCGILHPELSYLMETGFLNPKKIFFTPPGLHAIPENLEAHLVRRLEEAKKYCPPEKIIVLYGKKCYLHADVPSRRVDAILAEHGAGIVRIQADYGYDMLTSAEERAQISKGDPTKVLWFTLGWLKNWKTIYQRYLGWDTADANMNFPGFYDKIIVLDSIGTAEDYMSEHPEELLEIFDWTGVEVEFHQITLGRFKRLLEDALSPDAVRTAQSNGDTKG